MRRLSRVFRGNPKDTPAEQADDKWIVEERSIDQFRPIRAVVIGSGISGIINNIRLRQRIPNLDLCVYERNEDIGGTWLENRYPGCACGSLSLGFSGLSCAPLWISGIFQGLSWLTDCRWQISQHIPIKQRSNRIKNGLRSTHRRQRSINTGSMWLTNMDV